MSENDIIVHVVLPNLCIDSIWRTTWKVVWRKRCVVSHNNKLLFVAVFIFLWFIGLTFMICNVGLGRARIVTRIPHDDSCTTRRNFRCHLCQKTYEFKSSLQRHINLNHAIKVMHYCPDCRKGFKHRSSMIRHRIHCTANQTLRNS